MKILKHITMAACFSLLLQSCDDKPDLTIYTISGYLYDDCTMQPSANEKIEIIQDLANPPLGGGSVPNYLRATCTTDSNGYFKFQFTVDNKEDELIIRHGPASDLLTGIPAGENISDLAVYENPAYNIQLSLNVINPHETGDTLTISDFTGAGGSPEGLKVPCPLNSGVLYTYTDVPLLVQYYSGINWEIIWWFNEYNDVYEKQPFVIDKYCDDTIFVTADIY